MRKQVEMRDTCENHANQLVESIVEDETILRNVPPFADQVVEGPPLAPNYPLESPTTDRIQSRPSPPSEDISSRHQRYSSHHIDLDPHEQITSKEKHSSPNIQPISTEHGRSNRSNHGKTYSRDHSPSRDRKRSRNYSPDRWSISPPARSHRASRDEKHYSGRYRERAHDRPEPYNRRSHHHSKSPPRSSRYTSHHALEHDERIEKDKHYSVISAERGMRTVFIKDLPSRSTERDIEIWFEKENAPVRDVQLVFDRHRKFKGIGYVEFYQKSSVPLALNLSGLDFYGKKIVIESAEAERNFEPIRHDTGSRHYGSSEKLTPEVSLSSRISNSPNLDSVNKIVSSGTSNNENRRPHLEPSTIISTSPQPHTSPSSSLSNHHPSQPLRLYVGNLDYAITEDMVREIFCQFGPLDMCKLQTEANGQSKGRAFIQYGNKESALAAFYHLNQKEIAGRTLRVDFTRDSRAKDSTLPYSSNQSGSNQSGSNHMDQPSYPLEPYEAVGDLDDEGLKLTSQTRYLLMRNLAGISNLENKPSQNINPLGQIASISSIGPVTAYAHLKNMFDPSTETNPNFDLEIAEEVKDVACIHGKGDVYIHMSSVEEMQKTVQSVHGRFFAGRLVRAEYLDASTYESKFPQSTLESLPS